MKLKIDSTYIGEGYSPYIIAELSANHNGSIQRAKNQLLRQKKVEHLL
jgi:sialic acid synthase SpsE